MMKPFLLALVSLTILQGALSQTTTLDILPVVPGEDVGNLQGKAIGTGSDGTTFEISGTVSGIFATETLVKGATYVSEIAALSSNGVEGEARRQCGFDDQNVAVCTAVFEGHAGGLGTTATGVATGTISFAPVAVDLGTSSALALPCLTVFFAIVPVVGFFVAF